MATSSTEITFTSVVSNSAKNITLTDTVSTYGSGDFSAYAVGGSDANAMGKIVDPLGNTILNNTDTSDPNITVGGGSFSFNLPLDSNGNIQEGNYTITLTYFRDGDTATQLERSYTFNFSYTRPSIDLEISYSIINPIEFKSVDNTSYAFGGVTPTSTVTQVLYYPPSVGGTYTQVGKTLAVQTFYTGKGSVKATPVNSYAFTTGYYTDATGTAVNWTLNDTWSDIKNYEVSSVASSCDLECCLSALQKQVKNAQGKASYPEKLETYLQASSLLTLINLKFDCNKPSEVASLVEQFKQLTGCNDDCSCDTTPVQVIGVGTAPDRTRKGIATMTADVTSYIFTDLIGYNFANGDFMISIDGDNPETMSGYSLSFNTVTGEVSFGTTVYTGVKVGYYIIKP